MDWTKNSSTLVVCGKRVKKLEEIFIAGIQRRQGSRVLKGRQGVLVEMRQRELVASRPEGGRELTARERAL
jgi:hypothetical protein